MDRINADGSVTYWSVYQQVWIKNADPVDIPDNEIAAMPDGPMREEIIRRKREAVEQIDAPLRAEWAKEEAN